MVYPSLVCYSKVEEYQTHYERVYCCGPVVTFDGIEVRFRKNRFEHCFFESSRRDGSKDQFSTLRAQRIDWIRTALQDSSAELHVGWDRKRKKYDTSHRVAIVVEDYIVIIRLTGPGKAEFVTAYVADSLSTLSKIKNSPKWSKS